MFAVFGSPALYCIREEYTHRRMKVNGIVQKRAIVIHSPHSGRAQQLAHALTLLEQVGIEIAQVTAINELDDLPPQGALWQESGIDIAVAAGGDGLVGGVINHVMESSLRVGILPLGTANDIARSLHIPLDLYRAATVIASGQVQEVDIGMARPAEQAPHLASPKQSGPILEQVPTQKHGFFAHALTVGLNVQFARIATNVATRQRYGHMTYPFAALEVLRNHQALDVDLHFEGLSLPQQLIPTPRTEEELTTLRCRALQVAVINAPIFGGQWQLAIPGASVRDQLLDIVVIQDIEFSKLSAIITHFFKESSSTSTPNEQENSFTRHPADLSGIPGIHHLRAHGATIITNADPRDATLDGEVRGQTPMHVHMAERQLQVLVPA
jgi:diacylglycerol kinase (ATP)